MTSNTALTALFAWAFVSGTRQGTWPGYQIFSCSLPPERHSFPMDGDNTSSRFSPSASHPVLRHAPLHLFQRPCSFPVGQVHVQAAAPRKQNAKARRPATRSSAGSSRACGACNVPDLHPPTVAPRIFAPQTIRHHARTPERRCARDRGRFRQPGVPTSRRRPCRLQRHPAPRLQGQSAGMPSRHHRTTLFTDDFWNVRHICTAADSNGRVSVVARVPRRASLCSLPFP